VYISNGSYIDERASLFEKQRLRLRRALQDLHENSAQSNQKSATKIDSSDNNNAKAGIKSSSANDPIKNITSNKTNDVIPTSKTFQLKSPSTPIGNPAGSASVAASGVSHSSPSPRRALYAWEIPVDPNKPKVKFQGDYGVFSPTDKPGLYLKDDITNEAQNPNCIDFQVFLSHLCSSSLPINYYGIRV
jgi:hypothetical protein